MSYGQGWDQTLLGIELQWDSLLSCTVVDLMPTFEVEIAGGSVVGLIAEGEDDCPSVGFSPVTRSVLPGLANGTYERKLDDGSEFAFADGSGTLACNVESRVRWMSSSCRREN